MSLRTPSQLFKRLSLAAGVALLAGALPASASAAPAGGSPGAAQAVAASPDSPSQHSAFAPRRTAAGAAPRNGGNFRSGAAVTAGCTYDWSVVNTGITYTGDTWLNAVAGTSDSDVWVVGGQRSGVGTGVWQTLIEHFDGSSWAIVPSPNSGTSNNDLFGVAALATNDVWAVGFARATNASYRQGLALHWNGSSWSTWLLPNYNPYVGSHTAGSVWMTSSTDVWVAGYFYGSPGDPRGDESGALWHFNGVSWTFVYTVLPMSVAETISGSPQGLWVVGYDTFLAYKRADYYNVNGVLSQPNNLPGSPPSIALGVAGVDSQGNTFNPVAVGGYYNGVYDQTLVENYTPGPGWSPTSSPNLIGTYDNDLESISAKTSSDEWAVGVATHSAAGGVHDYPLELHYNGSGWQVASDSTRGDTASDFDLFGVAAVSSTSVYAVGQNFDTYAFSTRIEKLCAVPPDSITVSAPASTTAGTPVSVTVAALKASATMTTYRGRIHFSSSDPQAVLPADYTYQAADNGTHTFSVTLMTAGSQTITATDLGSSVQGMDGVTVSAAALHQLKLSAPADAGPNAPFNFTVTAQDSYGNTSTSYSGTVHFSSSDPGSPTLPADSTLSSGTGTFSATLKTLGGQTITAIDTIAAALPDTSNVLVARQFDVPSTLQYELDNSDGATWQEMDSALRLSFAPASSQALVLGANADLWTATAGNNQDLAIFASVNGGPDLLVGWKESGGFAGTFSPNAAYLAVPYTMSSGSSYLFKLKWKTNRPAAGSIIRAGAGPITGHYSPTRLTAQLLTDPTLVKDKMSTQQYTLTSSDGLTWQELDPTNLRLTVSGVTGTELLGANSDLWTANAGYNQDLAIFVSVNGGADQLLGWKESGGFAGTFSPNAAYVQVPYAVVGGSSYVFKLKWKTNKNAYGAIIRAGAGPISGNFSPTRLTAQLINGAAAVTGQLSTLQYTLSSSDGATWYNVDPALNTTVTPSAAGTLRLGGNADLWTANAGYNQDLAIFVSVDGGADQLVAWKESGGFAGTFSPNAAFVEAGYPVSIGHSYVFKLEWKTNRPAPGAIIRIGAGPINGAFSPTRLTVLTPG